VHWFGVERIKQRRGGRVPVMVALYDARLRGLGSRAKSLWKNRAQHRILVRIDWEDRLRLGPGARFPAGGEPYPKGLRCAAVEGFVPNQVLVDDVRCGCPCQNPAPGSESVTAPWIHAPAFSGFFSAPCFRPHGPIGRHGGRHHGGPERLYHSASNPKCRHPTVPVVCHIAPHRYLKKPSDLRRSSLGMLPAIRSPRSHSLMERIGCRPGERFT
jgi:hypothetical protein